MEKHVLSISEKKDIAYEKWLRKFFKAPFSKELDAMEKEALKKPQNNPYYQPLQGAWMNVPPTVVIAIIIASATIIKEYLESKEN